MGHPFCDTRVDPPNLACRSCWFKLPIRLRNLLKALIYKNASERLRREILGQATKLLRSKLEATLEKKVKESKYTVVPYKGRRVRKSPKLTRDKKLKLKYYGGPWDYQK